MPTNRPFLSNFLLAFRARSSPAHNSANGSAAPSSSPTSSPSNPLAALAMTGPVTAALAARHMSNSSSTSPSGSSTPIPIRGNRRSSSTERPIFSPPGSSEAAVPKLWVGGRDGDGRERFYRVQPVRRQRSFDKLSIDRVSL